VESGPGGAATELIKFALKATYALPGTEPVPPTGKSGARR
jgi:hypothetical protein